MLERGAVGCSFMSFERQRNTTALALAALLTATLALAACGGSSTSSSPNASAAATSTTSSSTSSESLRISHGGSAAPPNHATGVIHPGELRHNPIYRQALTKFSSCMREHGIVKFPQPNFSGHGTPLFVIRGVNTKSPQFAAALNKCRPELALTVNHLVHTLLGSGAGSGKGTGPETTTSASG
jgi:hypothetical protein